MLSSRLDSIEAPSQTLQVSLPPRNLFNGPTSSDKDIVSCNPGEPNVGAQKDRSVGHLSFQSSQAAVLCTRLGPGALANSLPIHSLPFALPLSLRVDVIL